MIHEILLAILMAGLPVGLASFGLAWWALKKNYIARVDTLKNFEREVKRRSKDKTLKKEGDSVHRRWLAFGGGFYGVVGLLTYTLVEITEVWNFILRLGGIIELIKSISFNLVIELFVGAIKNFLVAIAWPIYWMDEIQSERLWVWLFVAYGAYWAGIRLALRKSEIGSRSSG